MEFKLFRDEMLKHFNKMTKGHVQLFCTNTDRDKIWEVYLNSFPEEGGVRQSYNCNYCKSFLRQWGNLVVINEDNTLTSLWDFTPSDPLFVPVCENLDKYVTSCQVSGPFINNTDLKVGVEKNRCTLESGKIIYWNHFYLIAPKSPITTTGSIESRVGEYNSDVLVFKRTMDEISLSTVDTVLDLINQGSLYKGEENVKRLKELRNNIVSYKIAPDQYKLNYVYRIISGIQESVSHIRNSAIGTLLIDIEKGVDLDTAVTSYERITAPENYKRPKSIVTQKMINDAQKTITELGYLDSLPRRHAKISDITVNNVIYVDRNTKPSMAGQGNIFDQMKSQVKTDPKKLSKVEEIGIEDFIKNVVPNSQGIELLIENKHIGNFMTLTAPVNPEAKSMFKWNNGFSWSYNGDVTDSIKQKVKAAGGNIDADVRCSLHWFNYDDLDIHVIEPDGNEIFFSSKKSYKTGGELDIDMNAGSGNSRDAVENIFWKDQRNMIDGKYQLRVHNYCKRETIDVGFECEIECNGGESHKFEYGQMVKNNESILVAEFWYEKGKGITKIKSSLSTNSSMISKEEWGIKTGQYSKVSMIMYSPNYWDDQTGIGNKHYFFMIEGMKNPDPVRGFYNEYLKKELEQYHKRVFEVMGGMMKAEYNDDQLSGIGFSSTLRNEAIFKVKGSFDRLLKVKF